MVGLLDSNCGTISKLLFYYLSPKNSRYETRDGSISLLVIAEREKCERTFLWKIIENDLKMHFENIIDVRVWADLFHNKYSAKI